MEEDSTVESPRVVKPRKLYSIHYPHVLMWKGSIIPYVIVQTTILTILTAIVVGLFETKTLDLSISKVATTSTIFTTIIGIVVSLLLTYRTNTAYDRYWEGRKLWSTMEVLIRHITRYLWVGVREDGLNKDHKGAVKESRPEIIIEKRTAINLLLGFEYAAKHYLREEFGNSYGDLRPLIANIQSTTPGFKPTSLEDDESDIYNNSKVGLYSRVFRKKIKPHQREGNKLVVEERNLPLDITHYLGSYCHIQFENKRIDNPIFVQLTNHINGLTDCLTQFERILRSPIPLAYSIHLNQAVWIYCVSLPFFMVSSSHWATVPIVFIVSLILFGLERIGSEIENPFGYDENDLDLDEFCEHMRKELNLITSHKPPTIQDWVYAPENFPFENLPLSASDAVKLDIDEVRSILSVGSDPGNAKSSLEIQEDDEGENSEKKKTVADNVNDAAVDAE